MKSRFDKLLAQPLQSRLLIQGIRPTFARVLIRATKRAKFAARISRIRIRIDR